MPPTDKSGVFTYLGEFPSLQKRQTTWLINQKKKAFGNHPDDDWAHFGRLKMEIVAESSLQENGGMGNKKDQGPDTLWSSKGTLCIYVCVCILNPSWCNSLQDPHPVIRIIHWQGMQVIVGKRRGKLLGALSFPYSALVHDSCPWAINKWLPAHLSSLILQHDYPLALIAQAWAVQRRHEGGESS